MEITLYTSKVSVKCKMISNVFKLVKLPCEIHTIYTEDVGERFCMKNGINFVPTLIIKGSKDTIKLFGNITPQEIEEALQQCGD